MDLRKLNSGFSTFRHNPRLGFIIHFILVTLTCSIAVLVFRAVENSSPDFFVEYLGFLVTIAILSTVVSIMAAFIWRKQSKREVAVVKRMNLMKANEENLKTLVSSATEMLQIKDKEAIFKFITNSLHQSYPGTIIMFFILEEKTQKIYIPAVSGRNKNLIQKLGAIIDSDLSTGNHRLSQAVINDIKSGDLVEYSGSLDELCADQILSGIAAEIGKSGFSKVHIIGANREDSALSWITIITPKSDISLDRGFITAFVKQASIILQQKTAEIALEESEWQFRLLLNSAAEGIYGLNMNGDCIICNNKGLQILGYSNEDEVLGKNMHELIHHSYPDGSKISLKDCKIFKAFTDGKEIHSDEEFFFRKDGSIFPVEYWSYPLKHDEVVAGAVITFFDIHEKKKVIAEKQQNEANLKILNQQLSKTNSTKDRLFSIIAHDLRNPVTSMLGFSEMLIENLTDYDNETLKHYLEMLKSTTKNTLELLDNLLLWSKSQVDKFEFKPEILSLNPFLKRFIDEISPNADLKKISLRYLTTEENECYTDPDILKIVLRNILQNALKFTNEGGMIEIRDIVINGKIQISVKDNGVGMSKPMLDSLFNKEFNNSGPGTVKEKGSGLGLVLCREFVDKLGGEIRAESELGKGSTFVFTLPGPGYVN